jgi:hypothetical protein
MIHGSCREGTPTQGINRKKILSRAKHFSKKNEERKGSTDDKVYPNNEHTMKITKSFGSVIRGVVPKPSKGSHNHDLIDSRTTIRLHIGR